MVTTRSTTNAAGPGPDHSASAVAATTNTSNNRQKSPLAETVIMAGEVPVVVSVPGAPVVAFVAGVSVLGGHTPPVAPCPQNQPPLAALPLHLTRQDLVDFVCRQDYAE
ncbi:pyruvate dehydrogenase [Sesbania bispinosa]|nr:pyruvate dehydrogenase [Sesbania bispinosa]